MQRRKERVGKYIEENISIKWLFAGVVFYLYGDLLKNQIEQNSLMEGLSVNNWDVTLQLLNDMYLIVYFVIPVVLYLSINTILNDFDYQILIRLGSFKKWVFHSLKLFWKKTVILLVIWVFISIFMIIGLPYSWFWSEFSISNSYSNTLYGLIDFFEMPIFVLGSQLFFLLLTLSFLHISIASLYVLTENKNFILITSVVFSLGGMAGFKLLPEKLAFLSPTTYFSVTKAFNTFNSPFQGLVVIIIFGILCLLLLKALDLNKGKFLHAVKPHIPKIIYFFLCILGIVSTALKLNSNKDTIWDVWIMSFIGSSSEGFSYFDFFFYCIVFFGFIYLVNLFINENIERMGYYKIIRFRSLNKWLISWGKKLLIIVILFLFTLMVLSLVIAQVMGFETKYFLTAFPIPLYIVSYHFFINGFLQIVFYIFCVLIASWTSKQTINGVVIISVFMILMLPGVNAMGIIPVGLNSINYLTNYSPFYLTLILILANFLAYSVINYLFKRSLKF